MRAVLTVGVATMVFAAGNAAADRIREIEADISRDPDNVDLYVELGMAYEYVKDWENAAQAYKSALALAPNDPNIHYRLAETYLADDRLPQAVDEYRAVVRLDAEATAPFYHMGRAYLGMRDYEQARAAFEEFNRRAPFDFNGMWYLGQAYEGLADYRRALEVYEKMYDLLTGPYAGVTGVFGNADDLRKYLNKVEKKVR